MSAEAVLKQPLRLTTPRRPVGAVRTAPPVRSSKSRLVRATRLAPLGRINERKLEAGSAGGQRTRGCSPRGLGGVFVLIQGL
jgi:hypothetical protein